MRNHRSAIAIKSRLEIPVLCLRWTHDSINRKMMFGHNGVEDASILKLVDQLQRGVKVAGDINEPLDVAQHNERFYSLSNRRLTALMMFQSLNRDITVKAWCKVCSSDTQKFEEANSTSTDGLTIKVRGGESQHTTYKEHVQPLRHQFVLAGGSVPWCMNMVRCKCGTLTFHTYTHSIYFYSQHCPPV